MSWDTYEALLRDRGDDGPRIAYDRGLLEIVSTSWKRERLKKLLSRLVEAYSEELELDIAGCGSTTFKLQIEKRGLEPDESYYVQNEFRVRGRDVDLRVDPPPDVAIEIDLRRSRLDKLGTYEALGISEVWSHDGKGVVVHLSRSPKSFPMIRSNHRMEFLPPSGWLWPSERTSHGEGILDRGRLRNGARA